MGRGVWGNKVSSPTSLVPGNSLPEAIPNCNRAWNKIRILHSVTRGEEGVWISYTQDLSFDGAECPVLSKSPREKLLDSCLCWASQWLLWGKQGQWRFLLHEFHGFHLKPEVRQYHSGQPDKRKRNPMLPFVLKKPQTYHFWIVLNSISQST